MLIDYALLGNYLFLMLAFLWEAGGFDSWFSSSSADATDTETETPEEDPEGPEFIGTDFLDLISGTDAADSFIATTEEANLAYQLGAGDDFLDATSTDDYADGGDGNDTLIMREGDDIAAGGNGDDELQGGLGNDELWGQGGDDALVGSLGNDTLYGGLGSDSLEGRGDDDLVYGGDGDDLLSGDLLDDITLMDRGADTLYGGDGDDQLLLGQGDVAEGGAGADTFSVYESTAETVSAVQISDYDPEEDRLEIQYIEQTDPTSGDPIVPEITVNYSATTDTTSVLMDGVTIINLAGEQNITAVDITLTPQTV